jgi:hypothetical protein
MPPVSTPAPLSPRVDPLSLGARIRQLERELAELRRQQQADLMQLMTEAFAGEVFSARQMWSQPALRRACEDAGLVTVKQLGKWLRGWCGAVGRDGDGVVWNVSEAHLHDDAGLSIADDG